MYKAYKFRLYSTNEQQILINKTFGYIRFIYSSEIVIDINKI